MRDGCPIIKIMKYGQSIQKKYLDTFMLFMTTNRLETEYNYVGIEYD